MKREIKGFIAGVITTAVLSAGAFTALGEPVEKTITAIYNGIKIYVDGNQIQTKDALGNEVKPFVYNGSTYLPLRAIAEALGKEVIWEEPTNSVYIMQKPEKEEYKEVTVGTAAEFVKALGSNRKIILKPGVYDLSSVEQRNSPNSSVIWEPVSDGKELNLQNVKNLTIEGSSEGKTEITVTPRYAHIMNFDGAENITIKNIVAGHSPKEYACDAGVLKFSNSRDISIGKSELYGCGSIGLTLNRVQNLDMDQSVITQCSLRAFDISFSQDIRITQSKFSNGKEYDGFALISSSDHITFEKCEITDNQFTWDFIAVPDSTDIVFNQCSFLNNVRIINENEPDYPNYFISSMLSEKEFCKVIIRDSILKGNKSNYLAVNKNNVTFENCKLEDNTFRKGEYFKF